MGEVTEHLLLEVAAEQVNRFPLRPNTLEKSLPCFPWQLDLLAKAFCNILSLLATCRIGLIFALQALLLWKCSLEAASKSYLMNFCSSWKLLRLYNETVELKKGQQRESFHGNLQDVAQIFLFWSWERPSLFGVTMSEIQHLNCFKTRDFPHLFLFEKF